MGFGADGVAVVAFFAYVYVVLLGIAAVESVGLYLWSRRPVAWTPLVLVGSLILGPLCFVVWIPWTWWLSQRPRVDDDPRPPVSTVLFVGLALLVVAAIVFLAVVGG